MAVRMNQKIKMITCPLMIQNPNLTLSTQKIVNKKRKCARMSVYSGKIKSLSTQRRYQFQSAKSIKLEKNKNNNSNKQDVQVSSINVCKVKLKTHRYDINIFKSSHSNTSMKTVKSSGRIKLHYLILALQDQEQIMKKN